MPTVRSLQAVPASEQEVEFLTAALTVLRA